jgi:RNA polymerase sigma-70 factor, ECF subfamily
MIAAGDIEETDRRLVTAFLRKRGERSFRELYRRHTPRMLRLGRRLAGGGAGNAEDIVQEAWVRAVSVLDRFAWRSSLGTWLGGFVVHVAQEHRRFARSEAAASPPAGEDEEAVSDWADPVTLIALDGALRDLPPGFRSVLALHDVGGFTHAEIAELLGIEIGTSKSQLARARDRLRSRLNPDIDGEQP